MALRHRGYNKQGFRRTEGDVIRQQKAEITRKRNVLFKGNRLYADQEEWLLLQWQKLDGGKTEQRRMPKWIRNYGKPWARNGYV